MSDSPSLTDIFNGMDDEAAVNRNPPEKRIVDG
jgi:hypothetical protein